MERSDWESRWSEGHTAFHQSTTTPVLDAYADRVWGDAPIGRIYVPLCGKSLDMVFLAERGAEVVGVEFVTQAVEEFFAERGLAPEVAAGPPLRLHSGPYTLFAADIFGLTADDVGPLDGVFDRAALVALDADARSRYADQLRTLLVDGTRMLLVTFDYDQDTMQGPPFAVSHDEVDRLFADGFQIEHLGTRDVLDDDFRSRGLTTMSESAVLLTRRSD
jgi:thiopurine S-methyltransferase